MENRLDRLEGKVDSNFRWLLGAFATGFIILLTGGISGYSKLDDRLRTVEIQITKMDGKLDVLLERSAPKP